MSIAIAIIVTALVFEAMVFGVGLAVGCRGWELVVGAAFVHVLIVFALALTAGIGALWGWAL